jgi:hypothetical protein
MYKVCLAMVSTIIEPHQRRRYKQDPRDGPSILCFARTSHLRLRQDLADRATYRSSPPNSEPVDLFYIVDSMKMEAEVSTGQGWGELRNESIP